MSRLPFLAVFDGAVPGGLPPADRRMTTSLTYPGRLDRVSLLSGVRTLARRDRRLAGLVLRYGPPPLWSRPPGFATLLRIILEQQVTLASAAAVYNQVARAARPNSRLTTES